MSGAVPERMREREDLRFPRSQQFLHREFGRRVEIKIAARQIGRHEFGRESMQMRLVAGRHLQARRLDLYEALGNKPGPDGRLDPATHDKKWPAVGMFVGIPPGRRLRHRTNLGFCG